MRGRSGFAALGLAVLVSLAVSTQTVAQPGQETFRRGGGMFGGRGGPFGAGPLELVRRSDVRNELELTDSQVQEFENLAQSQLQQVRDQFRNLASLSREEQRNAIASIQETRERLTKEAREKINDVLSQNQRLRFAELEFRFHLQRGRIRDALVAAGVELDEVSRGKLDSTEQLVQADVRKRIAQIQQDANTAILAAVMDLATIERLMGDEFFFNADEPSGRRIGGSARRSPEIGDGEPDPDDAEEGRSNRRKRRDRSTREE